MFQVTGVTGFEMRNLTLDGTFDTDPNVYQDMGLGLTDAVDFRIHNVAFQNLSRGIEIHGDPIVTRGVIYLNTFTDMYYLDPVRGALGYGVVVYGSGTWPPLRLGTAQSVFIEDNTFTRNRHGVASNQRLALRLPVQYHHRQPRKCRGHRCPWTRRLAAWLAS